MILRQHLTRAAEILLGIGMLVLTQAGCSKSPPQTVPVDNEASAVKTIKEMDGSVRLHAVRGEVLSVDFYGSSVTDEGLKVLQVLKSLEELDLSRTRVTDAGLKELRELKGLQKLDLAGTDVSDTGLKELAGLTGLRTLRLQKTKVTDAGEKELKAALPNLQIER